ncbi:MAG TPA: hypothetical protein VM261_21710 [Kofleriaceae bacterium]|nr:hypothetical protein [Kofleriaceae bacterium]
MYWLAIALLPAFAFAARPGVSTSRRVLASALVLVVPFAGIVLAMMVRRTRGGAIELEPDYEVPRQRLSSTDATRLAEEPPVVDRLMCGDPGERLAALVALSSAADADAVAVLRWTVEHGSPDVVLDAALTLEEIELRCEARLATAMAAFTAAPVPDATLALDVAHAAEALVLNRLADAAMTPRLVAAARDAYARALAWAPEHATQIKRDLARLELAAGTRTQTVLTLAPAQPVAQRVSGEIEVARKPSLPRRVSQAFDVREVAAAALMS